MPQYYQETLNFHNTEEIKVRYEKLLREKISSVKQLEDWLTRVSRLQEEIEEGLSGHYIDFQCLSNSPETKKQFEYDQKFIEPLRKKYTALLDEKLLNSTFLHELPQDFYNQLLKRKKNSQELFREENIKLEIEEDRLASEYFEITGNMVVDWEGEEKSLSELSPLFESTDRETRKKAMTLSNEAFIEKEAILQQIMTELINIRHKKALNAGLTSYRDYMFKQYERFDYTPEDCHRLAQAVKKHISPLKTVSQRRHQKELHLDEYRPWDARGTGPDEIPLNPFTNPETLVDKAARIFGHLDPHFSGLLRTMDNKEMLDLTARKGKAPGGFCTPLPVTGYSFIFMNASGTHDDVVTILHEMGHCIHNDLSSHFHLADYKETPMESAELASMSMELLTMDYWNYYYEDSRTLRQAKRNHFRDILSFLPMGVIIDQFQHWMYENPGHTEKERLERFRELQEEFDADHIEWTGFEHWRERSWMRILHIFEVPFYFIEYVIAQLGALQIYKNYRENPEKTLMNYKRALKSGSSKSLPEIYEEAGISFDFSEDVIKELADFLKTELEMLENDD